MTEYQFPEWAKAGASFKWDFGPEFGRDNDNQGRLFHIRAFVDGQAVIREWSPEKERWYYTVEPVWYFLARKDHLVPVDAASEQGAAQ